MPLPTRPEVRWYTAGGSAAQFADERPHLTGVFSCCTGFATYPNASFRCPDPASSFWRQRNFGGPRHNLTVDHVIAPVRA